MRVLLAIILMLIAAPALSQSPGAAPIIRTTLTPSDGVVVGQAVTVKVAVLFPDEMQHPPVVRISEAAGAQIMRFETQGTTISETIDGRGYVGQSFEFVLFPRRGGTIEIPAPTVTTLNRAGDPVGSARGTGAKLQVTVPPGIDPSGPVLVADRVSVEQSWSPDPSSARFKPGGAVVRTIRRQADGVPALGMAEFRFTAPEGVRVYVDPPVIDDQSTRTGVDGHRTDKVTYVFEKPGIYEIPTLEQPWLTRAGKEPRDETLPGMNVTVAAGSDASEATHGSMLWVSSLAAVVLTVLAALLGWVTIRHWRSARARWRTSPEYQRRELVRIAGNGDARSTYEAAVLWRSMLTSKQIANLEASCDLSTHFDGLERALFAREGRWGRDEAHALARAVTQVQVDIVARRSRSDALPPLNP